MYNDHTLPSDHTACAGSADTTIMLHKLLTTQSATVSHGSTKSNRSIHATSSCRKRLLHQSRDQHCAWDRMQRFGSTSKQVQDAQTELAQFQTERSEVVKVSSSPEEQNDIEVLSGRALPQPDETLSQQMEAVVRAAAAFRTRSSGARTAEPMHQDMQNAQKEDGCRRRLRTRSQRSRRSLSR